MIGETLHENVDPNSVVDLISNPQSAIRNPQSPHPLEHRLIFKNIGRADWKIDIDTYIDNGGYEQLEKAVTMSRVDTVHELKKSRLRSRARPPHCRAGTWTLLSPH